MAISTNVPVSQKDFWDELQLEPLFEDLPFDDIPQQTVPLHSKENSIQATQPTKIRKPRKNLDPERFTRSSWVKAVRFAADVQNQSHLSKIYDRFNLKEISSFLVFRRQAEQMRKRQESWNKAIQEAAADPRASMNTIFENYQLRDKGYFLATFRRNVQRKRKANQEPPPAEPVPSPKTQKA